MNRRWLGLISLVALAAGCSDGQPSPALPIRLEPRVNVARVLPRTIERTVAQPGMIEAYERTAIYAKVAGFVEKWHVDIGQRVKAGQTLVELSAPEMIEQLDQMKGQVELDRVLVEQARKLVTVAESNVMAASEMVAQARADVARYRADVDRWTGEVARLTDLVKERVVDQQVLDETRRQLKSSQAAFESSQVAVRSRDAQRLAAAANVEKSKVDVLASEARVRVAAAEQRRVAALVGYLTITAPYDGIVFVRNVNSRDFIQPSTGDPSQGVYSLGLSPSRATPLYVVIRSDPVLFVVGMPEAEARYVQPGDKARVRVPALAGHEFTAKVTRTSWALESTSRTRFVQIELPNPEAKFLPGMYAYGSVTIKREAARAIPASAVLQIGNDTCCYLVVDGKGVRTTIQTGLSDGEWTEVAAKRLHARTSTSSEEDWGPFDGTELVVAGNLSQISDGEPVTIGNQIEQKP